MGERAFPNRLCERKMDLSEHEERAFRRRRGLRVASAVQTCARALLIVPCGVILVSCSSTEDSVAGRRDLAVQNLGKEQVWKSDLTRIEPQVMASAPPATPTEALEIADRSPAGGTEAAEDAMSRDRETPLPESGESNHTTTIEARRDDDHAPLGAGAGEIATGGESSTTASPGRDIPDEELVRQLLLRKLKRWEQRAGGFSDASNLSAENEDQQLARDIVSLSFLAGHRPLDKTGLEAAAVTLSGSSDREDLMRAALTFQQLGKTSESDDILRRLTGPAPDQETEASDSEPDALETEDDAVESQPEEDARASLDLAAPAAMTFQLTSVTFASRIDGPGDYVAMSREAIQPGKDVLVYGEFAGFRTVESRADADDQPTHARAFSATLRLQDEDMNVLEELNFLPPRRGRQFVEDPTEPVNFWARYEIPEDLGRGQYRILITAEDHFGGQTAEAELTFGVD